MKKFIISVISGIVLSAQIAAAQDQYDQRERREPPPEARQCMEEMRQLGCGNPREVGHEAFKSCIDSKKDQLSSECQNNLNQRPQRRE